MDFSPPSVDAGAEGGSGTATFSNLQILATMPSGERVGFPTFFPTNDAGGLPLPDQELQPLQYNTWNQAEAQVWWSDLGDADGVEPLRSLNGLNAGGTTSYLPTGGTNHTASATR